MMATMSETHLYSAEGQRAVRAESHDEAAGTFAARLARKHYGRAGCVVSIRRDSWTRNGQSVTWQAFIGRPAQGGGYSGHNIWITTHRD